MDNRPIGVFDSGLGGLTAIKELHRLLPNENFVYFGDTGRVPYGSRSKKILRQYSFQDVALLLKHDVKAVVSACGTVSSVAGELLRKHCPCPYLEVVSPAAERAAELTVSKRIGVIATKATINSGKFKEMILEKIPDAEVTEIACPLFVPIVEEGHIAPDDKLVQMVIELYLTDMKAANVDTLILGCTHYPILSDAISNFMGSGVVLVNSGKEVAKATKTLLEENNLLTGNTEIGTCLYQVSDSPQNFSQVAQIFLGDSLSGSVEHILIEDLEQADISIFE